MNKEVIELAAELLDSRRLFKESDIDKPMTLEIVRQSGGVSCVYINNYRVAGKKPHGVFVPSETFKGVTVREIANAIPELYNILERARQRKRHIRNIKERTMNKERMLKLAEYHEKEDDGS